MIDYTVEFINSNSKLSFVAERINAASAIALDIETINWWDRESERVSLIQLAFRKDNKIRVAVIDAMAGFDLESLRQPLELSMNTKAIHNANFDAVKLSHHFHILTSPIHDTMLAARRNGERYCSLQAQVEMHLGLKLDKTEQRSDWSRRPLSQEQLNYASLDAVCTLLLYEKQTAHGLRGDYQLRARIEKAQESLPLAGNDSRIDSTDPGTLDLRNPIADPPPCALALLGIITELSGRFTPEHLVASVGAERVGLAGWIVDHTLSVDAEVDEYTAKQAIIMLREHGLVRLSLSRKLEATNTGAKLWQDHKPRS